MSQEAVGGSVVNAIPSMVHAMLCVLAEPAAALLQDKRRLRTSKQRSSYFPGPYGMEFRS